MKKNRQTKLLVLDEIDIGIIKELQTDARQSYLSLGKKIGASEGTIRNRVKSQLKNEIMKLKAVLNPTKLGFDFSCILGLEVAIEKLSEAEATLAKNPNVYFLAACTGTYDLIAFLLFHNTQEFDNFMMNNIAKLPGIRRSQTFVNMRLAKTPWNNDVPISKLPES